MDLWRLQNSILRFWDVGLQDWAALAKSAKGQLLCQLRVGESAWNWAGNSLLEKFRAASHEFPKIPGAKPLQVVRRRYQNANQDLVLLDVPDRRRDALFIHVSKP